MFHNCNARDFLSSLTKNGPVHVDKNPMMYVYGEALRLQQGLDHVDPYSIPADKFDSQLSNVEQATNQVRNSFPVI